MKVLVIVDEIKRDDMLAISWTKLPPIAESCQQLTKCGIKQNVVAGKYVIV